jgi:hypothetical protein
MHAFGIDPFTAMVAVLVAALPSAGWVFIFALRYEADAGRISATILWTTALAFLTFSRIGVAVRDRARGPDALEGVAGDDAGVGGADFLDGIRGAAVEPGVRVRAEKGELLDRLELAPQRLRARSPRRLVPAPKGWRPSRRRHEPCARPPPRARRSSGVMASVKSLSSGIAVDHERRERFLREERDVAVFPTGAVTSIQLGAQALLQVVHVRSRGDQDHALALAKAARDITLERVHECAFVAVDLNGMLVRRELAPEAIAARIGLRNCFIRCSTNPM